MGIKADITVEVGKAFNTALADAVKVLSLTSRVTSYNPATGSAITIDTVTPSRGVASIVSKEHVDGEVVLLTDTSFLILQDELAATPEVDNTITHAGKDYFINSVKEDPSNATWTLIGRAA